MQNASAILGAGLDPRTPAVGALLNELEHCPPPSSTRPASQKGEKPPLRQVLRAAPQYRAAQGTRSSCFCVQPSSTPFPKFWYNYLAVDKIKLSVAAEMTFYEKKYARIVLHGM